MRLMILNARLAFPNLFEPRAGGADGTGKKKYGASLILPPNHPQIAEINAAIDAVGREKWGPKADAILKSLRATDKTALHDGDLKAQYGGFEGNLYISTRSDIKPSVRGVDPNQLLEPDSGVVYAGCYVNASIELWAQDSSQWGKRINAQLRGVQFAGAGDAFAAGTSADAEEFPSAGDTGQATDPDPMS